MNFKCFECGEDDSGRRLERILKNILKDEDVNVFKILRKNLVRVNDGKAEAGCTVNKGDIIKIAEFLFKNCGSKNQNSSKSGKILDKSIQATSKNYQLKTVFKNEHLWFIQKPGGINVQSAKKNEVCIASLVKESVKSPSLSFTAAPLHRLDKNTSGLLAISQSAAGARWFSEGIREHFIKKIYAGVVCGLLDRSFFYEDYIDRNLNPKEGFYTVKEDPLHLKKNLSKTKAVPLCSGVFNGNAVTLVQFEIETGHKHQIRFQSAKHGFPLLGDSSYGGLKGPFLLHSLAMIFPEQNPLGLPQKILCPFTDEFNDFIKLNLKNWDGNFIL